MNSDVQQSVQLKIARFDSIAINYVMHCVPGAFTEKGIAFSNLAVLLAPGGTLFGTTVLSSDVQKNLLARPFMWLMNVIGVFNNRNDSARDLEACLRARFEVMQFEIAGVTAYFAVKEK